MTDLYDLGRLVAAALEAENALKNYVEQLESRGAMLGYGRKVLRDLDAALKPYQIPKEIP